MVLYRCALDVEIARARRRPVLEALTGAPLGLRRHLGAAALEAAVRAGRLRVHYLRDEPWRDFEVDIARLSAVLPNQLVRAVQVEELQDEEGRTLKVTADKLVGRRGEVVRLPLRVERRDDGFHVDDEHEDLDRLRPRWSAYPRWVQDALRRKHPATRAW
jgi:hypothetical protein